MLAEVTLLKTNAVLYVMDDPTHRQRQDRQRERIYRCLLYKSDAADDHTRVVFGCCCLFFKK
ncbi:hypothetical protein BT092_07555, partial [Corynebacterium diphtheriae]